MFSRTPPPTRAPGDRRRSLAVILVGALVVYLVLTALGTLWTDYLWFDSVGFSQVWRKRWTVGIGLGAAGTAIAFLMFWLTLYLADRLGPRFFPSDLGEDEELVARFRYWTEGRMGRLRVIAALLLGLFVGVGVSGWRDDLFMFLSRQDFDLADPIFSMDVGFYVFQFPLIDMSLRWLFNLLATSAVLGAVAHYLNGGIRIRRGSMPTFSRGSKIHLSVLLALMALVRAAIYRMDALALLYSDRQAQFFGPGYTDVTARLPALRLLMAIALVAAVLFVVNIWRRGWTLALMAVAGWILVSVAALLIYPALVERLQVQPDAQNREAEYIANSIEFTRTAYDLEDVEVRDFPANRSLDADAIEANRLTIDNLRLWDTAVLPRTYQNLQEIRPYYSLEEVDTDRYMIDGQPTQTMVAVRELDEGNLGRTDWLNTRLIYTHGIGAVVSQANRVESDGQPQFLLADLPPEETDPRLALEQPRVYFGETYEPDRPVIVKTGSTPQEVDMPDEDERITANEYQGDAGVELRGIWRRIAFGFRYRDLNLLISGQIRPDSRVLVQRNIRAIASDLAPFLSVDSDPYPVVSDGRIIWVLDLYTSTSHFPYSQPANQDYRQRLPVSTDIEPGVNYISSSIKATVDAYDGTVRFYVVDDSDPIARAWEETFPSLFTDGEEMPEQLESHLRYPQDLFRIQGEIYLDYHVDEPSEFYTRNDAWSIPDDPATIRRGLFPGAELLIGDGGVQVGGQVNHLRKLLPYYLLTKLPNEEELSYLLLQPFNPRDKPNMSSFLVADAPTAEQPGRLIDFRMPQGTLVGGTGQVGERIRQNDEIATQFTLWSQQNATVIQGDILVVPIEESIMYVQPIYLQSDQQGGFPEFRRVVVVFGDRIEWAPTLDEAMADVFDIELPDGEAPAEPDEPSDGETLPGDVQELLDQAADALQRADEALREGDLAGYQRLIEEAAGYINDARQTGDPEVEASR
ncbi:MAG TPA: UPF0182 family protein [Acidimicrobiia bacterium]|nr:UPF0182 family protein [Acidimicrobiia bacterium]